MIASTDVHTQRDLWIELFLHFDRLTRREPLPADLLVRLWAYARWSSEHRDAEVQRAVWDHFFQNLKDTRRLREVHSRFLTEEEYAQYFHQDENVS